MVFLQKVRANMHGCQYAKDPTSANTNGNYNVKGIMSFANTYSIENIVLDCSNLEARYKKKELIKRYTKVPFISLT